MLKEIVEVTNEFEDVEKLYITMKEQGAKLDKVRVRTCEGKGRGLVAACNISKGEEILFIPLSLIVTPE